MTRTEEIYESVLPEMKAHDIEDTVDNRITFLTGLYDVWKEDSDRSVEKTLYMLALTEELSRLIIRKRFPV